MVEPIAKRLYDLRQATYKIVEMDEMTFTSPYPWFKGRRDGDLIRTYHEILSVERTSGATTTTIN